MVKGSADVYAGRDPGDVPAYPLADAAAYLFVPVSTLRSWVQGRTYHVAGGERQFRPVIRLADPKTGTLSFRNLIELSVLAALRRRHMVKLPAIRRAVRFLEHEQQTEHPLADLDLQTDSVGILVEQYGRLLSASEAGQQVMREVLEKCLHRVERDASSLAWRWYPFTSQRLDEQVRAVVVDPRVQFGRPCIAGSGVPTSVVEERFKAGDTIKELARDYGCQPREIEEAIRFERYAA